MILTASIILVIIGGLTLAISLCKAAALGDRIMRDELDLEDAEEMNKAKQDGERGNIRSILGKILK